MAQSYFNRYEFKYIISWRVYTSLRERLAPFCEPDRFCREGMPYDVLSLYYDTKDYRFYFEKVDGVNNRKKLRIRAYGDGGSSDSCYIELKNKIRNNIFKKRVRTTLREAYDFFSDPFSGLTMDGRTDEEQAVARDLDFHVSMYRPEPKAVISYKRTAYKGRFSPNLRITFDTMIRCRNDDFRIEAGTDGKFLLQPNLVLMEIKGNNHFYLWLSRLLACHEVELFRFSKYCLAVDTLNKKRKV